MLDLGGITEAVASRLEQDVANLTYEFVPLDPGTTIQADLSLYDFGGNVSTLSSLVEVP